MTTRFDEHAYAATGISADLEQQRRERTLGDQLPTRADWMLWCLYMVATLTGIGILWIAIGVIETALRYWLGEG